MVNEIFTSVVLEQGTQEAPDSAIVFPLRCYRRLCILDLASSCYEDDKHIRTEVLSLGAILSLAAVCWREVVVH
jgi:hypothetical protein